MLNSTISGARFILLWILCPIIALATFRFLFGGVAGTMEDFLYHADSRPIAFFLHIVLASVALALVPVQLSKTFRKRRLNVHRWLGRIYVASIALSGWGGFALAVSTESGFVASWGFALLAVSWVGTTVVAMVMAMTHSITAHQNWMIRSAALTMAAVSLRLYIGVGAAFGFDYGDIAGLLAWACWVPNLIIAEFFIHQMERNNHRLKVHA